MKKNILVWLAVVLTLFGMALPLRMAFAKGPTGSGQAGISQVQARAGSKVGQFKHTAKAAKRQAKVPVAIAQTADACANDTPDNQEVSDGADTDTDNVDLQCGDQSGPDEQVSDASGSDTGAPDTDNVQDETPGSDAAEQPMSAPAK
jgi:hypothetical protein